MSNAKEQDRKAEIKVGGMPVIEFYENKTKVRILDVVLDVLPLSDDINARRFIPQIPSEACWDTPTVLLIRDMAIRLAGGISSRNEGPTGVSKSFAVEVICALTNRSYLRHNYSKETDIGDTIGRFVPSDEHLTDRFEELIADPDLTGEARKIVEKAQADSRPLTMYESKKVAKVLGMDLNDHTPWKWKNGTLTGSMMYGSVYGADEVNLAPGNILERENSAIEKHPTMRLVEHEGEVIRPLTPEEQSIIDNGGIVPGIISLNTRYWYVAAQNPYGIGGGRFEESEARRNRLQDRIVEALTPNEYKEFLSFLIHGNQPDVIWQNRRYKGDTGVQTPYRQLENIPQVDVWIDFIANLQFKLFELQDKGKIGSEKDIKGGSYVYTRRNLLRVLDSLLGTQSVLLDVEETARQKRIVKNTNWHDLVMEAVYQEYVAGAYKADQAIVRDLIEASDIENVLGPSKNNPTPPKWVQDLIKKGGQAIQSDKGWIIS
jgi:hypothetical protein